MDTPPTQEPSDDALFLHGCKALTLPDGPPSRWTRFCLWLSDDVFYALPASVRHSWYTLSRHWHDQITCRLFPRQRWLTKQIPRTWCDKTGLIPLVLYSAVIHLVEAEGEDCFTVTDWPGSGLAEQEKQLREVYAWAKVGRAAFQARIEAAHPPLSSLGDDSTSLADWLANINREDPARDAAYKEVWRLEAEMEAIDTKHLTTIISLRQCLWT